MENKERRISEYDIGQCIGVGRYGRIFKAQDTLLNMAVAIKVTIKEKEQSANEVDIHRQLSFPSIVDFYGCCCDESKLYLVLEYCPNGDVFKELKREKTFSERHSAVYIKQVASALAYCHSKHIIHRDLKPENLLLAQDGQLKLADFGWAVSIKDDPKPTEVCGTLDYLPPEMIVHKPYDTFVDMWALGVLMYEFLVGVPAFDTPTFQETCERIQRVKYVVPDHVSELAEHLIISLLLKLPSKRLTAEQVLSHPWLPQ